MFSTSLIEGIKSGRFTTKLRSGDFYIPVTIFSEDGRLFFEFKYSAGLINAIKTTMDGRKYHGFIEGDGRKIWSVPISYRNLFRLTVLQGKFSDVDPYAIWSQDIKANMERFHKYACERMAPLVPYKHQDQAGAAILTYHWYVVAAEMGLGKTLTAILATEIFAPTGSIVWAGPNSALVAARAEFRKWRTPLMPLFTTYDSMRKLAEGWRSGDKAPQVLILDEASRVKTPTAQRSIAARHIADSMRRDWGWDNCLIVEMSGSPAPKSPVDWHNLCEVACPGFLTEADIFSMRERLAFVVDQEQFEGGGTFKKVKAWKDDEKKCAFCAEVKDHPNHIGSSFEAALVASPDYEQHEFKPSINEVAKLSQRMAGLVGVWKKEDCLDLPRKRYEMHELAPTQEILNAAKLIVENSTRAADALIRLRTLSDGFLYQKVETGETIKCSGCDGCGKVLEYYDPADPEYVPEKEELQQSVRYVLEQCPSDQDPIMFVPAIIDTKPVTYQSRSVECFTCGGKGVVPTFAREVQEIACPKIGLLEELLEQHEEDGRFVVYSGFTGSINRITKVCLQKGWTVIKADGHGWVVTHPNEGVLPWKNEEAIYQFQNGQAQYDRIVFNGQPGSSGMGLTLTASPSTFFYSNDFVPENRIQAEDRGHRIGMKTYGGRVIDCVHLPSDKKVIQALVKSRNLLNMSMKGLREMFK